MVRTMRASHTWGSHRLGSPYMERTRKWGGTPRLSMVRGRCHRPDLDTIVQIAAAAPHRAFVSACATGGDHRAFLHTRRNAFASAVSRTVADEAARIRRQVGCTLVHGASVLTLIRVPDIQVVDVRLTVLDRRERAVQVTVPEPSQHTHSSQLHAPSDEKNVVCDWGHLRKRRTLYAKTCPEACALRFC